MSDKYKKDIDYMILEVIKSLRKNIKKIDINKSDSDLKEQKNIIYILSNLIKLMKNHAGEISEEATFSDEKDLLIIKEFLKANQDVK